MNLSVGQVGFALALLLAATGGLASSALLPPHARTACDRQDTYRSPNTVPDLYIGFYNARNEPLDLEWIAPNGELYGYGRLDPYQIQPLETQTGAGWIVRDGNALCLAIISADEVGIFRIRAEGVDFVPGDTLTLDPNAQSAGQGTP